MLKNISANDDLKKALHDFIDLLKPNTADAYERDITDYLDSVRQPDFLQSIAYFQSLAKRGYSKASIGRKKAAVSSFVDFLKDNQRVAANPFTTKTFKMAIKKIYQQAGQNNLNHKPPASHLDWGEVELLIRSCSDTLTGTRDKAVVMLGVYGGLRRSEMATLQWRDIRKDLHGHTLILRNAKGGTGEIDVHAKLLTVLGTLKQLYEKWHVDSAHILISTSNRNFGRPLTSAAINRIIHRLCQQAGISEITAHDLRHTCAVQMLSYGAGVERVAAHLRHKNIQTTMTYLKTIELHTKSAVRFLP